jgi:hypothetical protein
MVKLFNLEALNEEKVKRNHATHAIMFRGNADENRISKTPDKRLEYIVPMTNTNYVGSAGYHKLWQEIGELHHKVNAAQAPAAADLEALLGKIFIDITRRAQESPDLTSRIAIEETDLEFAETINLREIYKYIGYFDVISGANDSVPLIEQALGETDSVTMEIVGAGWKDSLKNLLFNKLHTIEKVNQAVIDADTDYRNSKTVGTIVGATYVPSQKQVADATDDSSLDYRLYRTIDKAVKKLRSLKDYRTERKIAVPSVALLCNSADAWNLERVIRGQLTTGGTIGTITSENVQALPINEIITYDQGITDGFTWGKETLSFPGVTEGKCYVFVPREYFWILNKRPLTLETGRGSTLQLSTEERAWYRVQTKFEKLFLGSSYPATAIGAGYGAVIEVTLPTT